LIYFVKYYIIAAREIDQNAATSATYPLILTNLAQVRCVVVGGGGVAQRKVRDLLAGGARPIVISPALSAALATWRDEGRIEHVERVYRAGDLVGAFLAIAATDDRATNAAIAADGRSRGILVNIADDPRAGNFHTAAVVRRGDLLLAVSTAGGSPALTAHIRRELEARYGDEYARLLSLLRSLRAGAARVLPPDKRTALWQRLVADTLLGWLRDGEDERAEQYAQEQIEELTERLSR
jgi:precorrin-2 dehydrogenase/sirohydrochlorin ferrochelatase